MSILAIGAHPDDIEIGCGGALYQFASSGRDVYLAVMSLGGMGGEGETRKREQLRSKEILMSREVWFQDYEDTRLPQGKELIDSIEVIIQRVQPHYIFVNFREDTHQDHRVLARATMSATRNVHNVLFYEVPTTHNFIPNVFVDISPVMDKKTACLEAHRSQVMKTNIKGASILDIAQSAARFRGVQGRTQFAEGFVSQRLFLDITQ